MNDILNKFIKKLEQKNSIINFNFGVAVYNKIYEELIKCYNSYSTFSFSVLKKTTSSYLDKYYNYEDAQKIKSYVENDLKIKEKNTNFIRYGKHIILASIAKFIMRRFYNKYHKEISYNNEGLQKYIYNNLYQEVIDITSQDGKMYFTDFNQLSKAVVELGFSNEDLLNIVLEIVKLNIERYEKLKYKNLPFCGEMATLNIEYNHIKDACNTIYENYINKPQNEKDIQCLYDCLISLRINKGLCNKIAFSLSKKAKKVEIRTNNNSQFIMPRGNDNMPFIISKGTDVLSSIKPKDNISKKEQIAIVKELETYFDFKNMKPIRLLSLNEIIYCVYLLMKNSADSETINNFMVLSIKRIRKENPLYIYNDLYNKLNYLKDKYEIENIIANINKEIEKIFICNDSEYIQVKYVISDYIKFILNEIGNDFEYEKEEATKIMVLNKNT